MKNQPTFGVHYLSQIMYTVKNTPTQNMTAISEMMSIQCAGFSWPTLSILGYKILNIYKEMNDDNGIF